MKLHSFHRSTSSLAVCIAGLALTAISANAAITISSTAPSLDGGDQGKVGASDSQNFGKSFNSGTSDVGQTFTTSANVGGYAMDSVSFKIRAAQTDVGVTTPATFLLRLIQITGGDGTTAGTYTTVATYDTGHSFTGSFAVDDWFTLSLPATVVLAANTLYGVDIRVLNAGTGISFGTSMKAGSGGYAAGRFYDPGWGSTPTSSGSLALNSGEDMMFHVNLAAIPEPSASLLGGIATLLLLRRRR
jgi:hypothetical protein